MGPKRDHPENRTVVVGAATVPPQPPETPPRPGAITRGPSPTPAPAPSRLASPEKAVPLADKPVPSDRFDYVDLIGVGGMGEVHRVRDRELGRYLAMKVIRHELLRARSIVARFIEEAQATAQLEHPGIVPVHDFGRLPDGRWYFMMKEVKGRTLRAAQQEWSRTRAVDAFHRVCEAVAHAHDRGVIHRDLKPDNVMVGAYGEVLVLDWGLAKVIGRSDVDGPDDYEVVATTRSGDQSLQTRFGMVAGTPMYMPPEQARGEIHKLDARSDVYALGAMLYEILSGRPPFVGEDANAILERVKTESPEPLDRALPDELVLLCERAMAREPAERFPHAGALAEAIRLFQEGEGKRARALQIVDEAQSMRPLAGQMRARAAELRQEAARKLHELKPSDPVDKKKPAWDLQDEASHLETEAELSETKVIQVLQGALTHAPDLNAAHELLADLYRERHEAAEAARDLSSARRYEALLTAHDTGKHAGWLRGTGRLSLVTDPPADVELFRYVERDRRLVPERVASLGRTPLREVALSMGNYLCVLRAPGRAEVRYPVTIGREEHWDSQKPGDKSPTPVHLPRTTELGRDDVYVPAGWAWIGGDPNAPTALPRQRAWIDGFVMRRFPVTNADYLRFLNDLVANGQADLAEKYVPRERGGQADRPGARIYGVDDRGRYALVADSDGDVWHQDYPVFLVDAPSAAAYAAWEGTKSGGTWRLPTESEREKAGRGADGRFYPWGDFFDPTWACVRESHARRPLPATIDRYDTDESPYGVRGLCGNASDWCQAGMVRGGNWSASSTAARLAYRRSYADTWRSDTITFRVCRTA